MSSSTHSRSSSVEAPHRQVPSADVEKDLLGLREQIKDNISVWYSLKHPGKKFEFNIVTCSYKPPSSANVRDLYSAMAIATVTNENGSKEIHSKHDVRSRDSYKEDLAKTRIEALETLLADLEYRMDQCMHQYDTRLKRAPRADRKPWQ